MATTVASVAEDLGRVLGDAGRRRALRRSGLLDSANETVFDRLTRMACSLLCCEVALISLVDHDRQFFKSSLGLPEFWHRARQTPLTHSFCQYVVASAAPLAGTDAREVACLHDNQAIRDLGVIAYLGVPLRAADGHVIGAVCAIEAEPRPWTEDDVDWLFDLAEIARSELILRYEAGHDPLTGLANRRRFTTALAEKAALAQAGGARCSVLALDLDRFKPINDRRGTATPRRRQADADRRSAGPGRCQHWRGDDRGQLRRSLPRTADGASGCRPLPRQGRPARPPLRPPPSPPAPTRCWPDSLRRSAPS